MLSSHLRMGAFLSIGAVESLRFRPEIVPLVLLRGGLYTNKKTAKT